MANNPQVSAGQMGLVSIFSVLNNHCTEEDILQMLLQDTAIRASLKEKGATSFDIFSQDFGFSNFHGLKTSFGKHALPLMRGFEGDIKMVFDDRRDLKSTRGTVLSKKATAEILLELLEALEVRVLEKNDFKKIRNRFIRTHFCRWALLYLFLNGGQKIEAILLFRDWLRTFQK